MSETGRSQSVRTAADQGRAVVVGLTGPIGCGKTTVSGWLAELGAVVIDADVVAREVVERGSPTLEAVRRAFGGSVIKPSGDLDREALGRIVFADPAALARLEAITHPAVRPRILVAMRAAEVAGAPGIVIEAIKLVEGGLADLCNEVWLVTCDPAEQRARLEGRGMPAADATQRMAAQGDLSGRAARSATRTLNTTGPLALARAATVSAWQAAMARR